jgi:hypothetical protein
MIRRIGKAITSCASLARFGLDALRDLNQTPTEDQRESRLKDRRRRQQKLDRPSPRPCGHPILEAGAWSHSPWRRSTSQAVFPGRCGLTTTVVFVRQNAGVAWKASAKARSTNRTPGGSWPTDEKQPVLSRPISSSPGDPVAPARAAAADRHVVADESTAAVDPDRWPAHETCAVLLPPLAEGHLTRSLFGAILRRLTALSVPAG